MHHAKQGNRPNSVACIKELTVHVLTINILCQDFHTRVKQRCDNCNDDEEQLKNNKLNIFLW